VCWTLVINDEEDVIQESKGVPPMLNAANSGEARGLGERNLMEGWAFLLNWPHGILTEGRPRTWVSRVGGRCWTDLAGSSAKTGLSRPSQGPG